MNSHGPLVGKNGIVVGMANEHSIAFGCIEALAAAGARTFVTYQNTAAAPFALPPLAALQQQGAIIDTAVCDVRDTTALSTLAEHWQRHGVALDFVVHAVAFAPAADLHGRVIDASRDGFLQAIDVSCHSFIRLAKTVDPLWASVGGALLTLSYYGAEKVVPQYNLMGPVKAALEASVRELASELGPRHIRVNAIAPGPIFTRAASGIDDFKTLAQTTIAKAPLHRLTTIAEVGALAAFLAGDTARSITGAVIPVDAGYHIMA